jgi:hypothetical protein
VTRYLEDDEVAFDDTLLDSSGSYAADTWGDILRRLLAVGHCGVVGLALFLCFKMHKMAVSDKIDSSIVCREVNKLVMPYYMSQWAMCGAMLLAWHWFWVFLLHTGLAGWHALLLKNKQHLFQAYQLDSQKIHIDGWVGTLRRVVCRGLPWKFVAEVGVLLLAAVSVTPYLL